MAGTCADALVEGVAFSYKSLARGGTTGSDVYSNFALLRLAACGCL